MKTCYLLLFSVCVSTSLLAQTWSGSAVSGTWSDPQNWNNGIPTGSNQIILAGTDPTNMTNDLTLTLSSQMIFPSGSSGRVISGSSTMVFTGGSKMENNSGNTQTIAFPIAIDPFQSTQFTSSTGNIVLTGGVTLNNGGTIETQVTGAYVVDIQCPVTGDGTLKAINNGNINFGSGGSMTGGSLVVQGSTASFSGDGHLSSTTHVKLSNGAKFDIGSTNLIVRSLEFENGDQIVTLGGSLTIAGGNGAPSTATQPGSGSITGSGSLIKEGSETLILQGQQQFTGSMIVNGGSVELATMNAGPNDFKPAAIIVAGGATLRVTQNMFINSLTLKDGANVYIAPGITFTPTSVVAEGQYSINGGGTLSTNISTISSKIAIKQRLSVFARDNAIYISNRPDNDNSTHFEIYSTSGNLIQSGMICDNKASILDRPLSKGVYIVKIITATDSFNSKLILK